jgi:hypothetical protein
MATRCSLLAPRQNPAPIRTLQPHFLSGFGDSAHPPQALPPTFRLHAGTPPDIGWHHAAPRPGGSNTPSREDRGTPLRPLVLPPFLHPPLPSARIKLRPSLQGAWASRPHPRQNLPQSRRGAEKTQGRAGSPSRPKPQGQSAVRVGNHESKKIPANQNHPWERRRPRRPSPSRTAAVACPWSLFLLNWAHPHSLPSTSPSVHFDSRAPAMLALSGQPSVALSQIPLFLIPLRVLRDLRG